MSDRLIALYKQPGVRLFGVGETWRLILDKFVLRVTGPEAPSACQDDQICTRLKSGIYSAVHGVQDIWDTKSNTEGWGFLLVDAKKRFQMYQLNRNDVYS